MRKSSVTANMRHVPGVLMLFLFLYLSPASGQEAVVSEGHQSFRTYPFSDPDAVARMSNIYPYFRFQGYSLFPVMRAWKVITLENQYIRVLVAPEIGGKILGAFEKSTGRAFIYFNRVVKFREIAMRGPWTSGGIEFNFGDIGHTPTTATPVDYLTRKNPDGSVSCFVGALDLPSRTEWRVEIRLPRDKASFETRSFWYNPTDVNTSRYHWMNAAADADSDLQVLYPGNGFIGHGGEPSPWPIDTKGRDLSYYRNNAFGSYKSYHVTGVRTDFFGGRWDRRDFGVIHWARYTDKPGKKLWIWGLSREGEIWKDILTDPDLGNGQYVEIQSGLHFNQAISQSSRTPFKHLDFPPCSAEQFTEVWFPFRGIRGVTRANPHGALNVRQSNGKLFVEFCPIEAVREELSVDTGNTTIYTRPILLRPLESFVDSMPLSRTGDAIAVRVGNLIEYRSEEDSVAALSRPIASNDRFDWNSAYGLSVDARECCRQRDYEGGFEKYRASLRRDPTFVPSLVGIAELFYRRMEIDSALQYVMKALALDTYDPDANYIYGLVQRRRNHLIDAEDGFGVAARSTLYRAAASVQLAEIAFIRGHLQDAQEFASRALTYDRFNVRAQRLLAVLCRLKGDSLKAGAVLGSLLDADPLSHFARCEAFLREPTTGNRTLFISMIRNELPAESFLELGAYYLNLRRFADAARVLQQSPGHPMVYYWLAYSVAMNGDRVASRHWLDLALQEPPHLVFPHRWESADILEWAEAQRTHWKSRYYRALLYWSKGRRDVARRSFSSCGNEPDYAPFYLARGDFFRNEDATLALDNYREALRLGPDEWRTYSACTALLNERGMFDGALAVARSGAQRLPGNYMLRFALARTFLFNGDHGSSLAILDTLTILPFEGARYGRDTYRQACVLSAAAEISRGDHQAARLLLARARLWPERLGAGKPYDVDNRLEDYLEALECEHTGSKERANTLFKDVVRYSEDHREFGGAQHLIGAFALRKLGRGSDAKAFVDVWLARDPANPVAQWAALAFSGDHARALELEHVLRDNILHRASGDQEFVLVVDVVNLLHLE